MKSIYRANTPSQKILVKIIKYLFFTIIMAWTPIVINYFVSFFFDLEIKEIYLYTSDICYMTIILASTNIKDLLESNILKTNYLLFILHIILNILNIVLSLLFIGILSYIVLSKAQTNTSNSKQFTFIVIMYVLAVILGMIVQIGGVIKWKK